MTFALLGALFIGLSLGLLGSGGSILTVPVLVYLLHQPEKVAIAGSLAIVGTISFFGALPYARRGLVHWRSVLFFGLPGMVGTTLGAFLSRVLSGHTQMIIFGLVLSAVAFLMTRTVADRPGRAPRAMGKVALDGLAVGVITGVIGIGGGFLIVPALVLLGGLAMRQAIGTSLVVIALNSASGFAGHLQVLARENLTLDGTVIAIFAAIGTTGCLVGYSVASRLPQLALRRVFGGLLAVVAIFVLWTHLVPGAEARPSTPASSLEGAR
ncbi:MAG: sulfite exporter TauE/SafE family protein [Planctomycetota bacterium]